MSERIWPIAEAAQADYEALRAAALAGEPARDELAAARFARRGLGGLIAWRADDHQVVAEFVDDGYSGARLDRPALDRLRDAAEAGALDAVLCLCTDRLARAYAYQVLILDELERFGVPVHFLDGPAPGDDPQARLLIQVQGVIAEYERAKIAERFRRGKLHRARAGEVFF